VYLCYQLACSEIGLAFAVGVGLGQVFLNDVNARGCTAPVDRSTKRVVEGARAAIVMAVPKAIPEAKNATHERKRRRQRR
jgi:hypothetical protein